MTLGDFLNESARLSASERMALAKTVAPSLHLESLIRDLEASYREACEHGPENDFSIICNSAFFLFAYRWISSAQVDGDQVLEGFVRWSILMDPRNLREDLDRAFSIGFIQRIFESPNAVRFFESLIGPSMEEVEVFSEAIELNEQLGIVTPWYDLH